jgi:hypothetical protein
MKNPQAKVGRVMREFKSGELKSSSGQKVTNPKQAIAIGLSEAGISKKAKGGDMKESKAMMKKEVSFMKKKGAPKSMLKHEMAEAGMNDGGKVKKMAMGGQAGAAMDPRKAAMMAQMMKAKRSGARPGMAPAPAPMTGMKKGGAVFTKSADGIAKRGKTQGTQVKMAMGGSTKKYC